MESNVSLYKLNQKGKEYILKICIVGDTLRLTSHSISNQSVKFTRDLTLEDLKQLDKIFFQIQTLLQALECFDKTLRAQKVKVFENSEAIIIQFYFESESQSQMEIPLTEQVMTTTNEINSDFNYDNNYNYQNIETTNYAETNIDTGIDLNNYDITSGTEETTNIQDFQNFQNFENIESTQPQEDFTAFNANENEYQYQSTQETQEINNIPPETFQVQTNEEYTTNTLKKTFYAPPYIAPVEEDNIPTQEVQTTENIENIITTNITNEINNNLNNNDNFQYENHLNEMKNLKQEFEQINELKKKLNELNNLRNKELEENELREKIRLLEKIKLEQEQEIRELRQSQIETEKNKIISQGMQSQQLYLEDKPEQICVKGDIIHNAQELELISRKITKLSTNKLTLNLLFKATADSDKASAFHQKCDKAQSTIVLIETDKGKRFGGFTTKSWEGECIEKKDENAFVFSLDKMMTYDNIPGEVAIGCYPKFGPIFMGCQIRIYDNAFTKGGTTFEKGMNYNTEEDYELTGGDRVFNVKEIEVYEVIAS